MGAEAADAGAPPKQPGKDELLAINSWLQHDPQLRVEWQKLGGICSMFQAEMRTAARLEGAEKQLNELDSHRMEARISENLSTLEGLFAEHERIHAELANRAQALHDALARGDYAAAILMVEKGYFKVDHELEDGTTPLICAARAGSIAGIHALHKRNADLEYCSSKLGQTALFAAAQSGQLEALRALLDLGADVGGRTVHGGTPLLGAVRGRNVKIMSELLSRGADAAQIIDGEDAKMISVTAGQAAIATGTTVLIAACFCFTEAKNVGDT